jgi:hypothetical protein
MSSFPSVSQWLSGRATIDWRWWLELRFTAACLSKVGPLDPLLDTKHGWLVLREHGPFYVSDSNMPYPPKYIKSLELGVY